MRKLDNNELREIECAACGALTGNLRRTDELDLCRDCRKEFIGAGETKAGIARQIIVSIEGEL